MRVKGMGIIKRGIAVGLIALMACTNPLQTLSPANGSGAQSDDLTGQPTVASAAEKAAPYVGEVRLAVDKDAAKAKQILEDAGYEVIDQDLNEKAGSFWNDLGDQAVFMGIKRTADENKAIRDMKTMNMLGKYSYSDLRRRIEGDRREAEDLLSKLQVSLNEYRNNYQNKDYAAMKSYRMMNGFREDDSGKTMGDFFLDDINKEELVKVLLESNDYAKSALIMDLAYAVESPDEDGDLWTDRISKVTSYNAIVKKYAIKAYGTSAVFGKKKEEVEKQITGDLEDTARTLLKNWGDIRKEVSAGDKSEVKYEDLEADDISEEDSVQVIEDLKTVTIGEYAKSIRYGKKSLYDLFMVNAETFEKDITKLYPLAYALSEGQRGIIDMINPVDLVYADIIRRSTAEDGNEVENEVDKMTDSLLEGDEVCSIYEGVDRDMYMDGAAMTSMATQNMENSGENKDIEAYKESAKKYAVISAVLAGATLFAYAFFRVELSDEASRLIMGKISAIDATVDKANKVITIEGLGPELSFFRNAWRVTLVLSVIFAGISIYNYIRMKNQEYNRNQLPIPGILVDFDTENEAGKYVTYHVVRWNRDRGDKDRADHGDLNGDAAREWLALYTTTDKAMGAPILADGIIANVGNVNMPTATGNGTYEPLTIFGRSSAQNLVDKTYSYNDEVGGIYLWYMKATVDADTVIDDVDDEKQETEAEVTEAEASADEATATPDSMAETTASNIGGSNSVFGIVGGAVGGFILGMVCMFFIRRKKVATVSTPEDKK